MEKMGGEEGRKKRWKSTVNLFETSCRLFGNFHQLPTHYSKATSQIHTRGGKKKCIQNIRELFHDIPVNQRGQTQRHREAMSFPLPPNPYSTPFTSDDDDDNGSYTPHKSSSDLNSKIMLTAIVSLSVVIALVITLHIYARCVLRRRARRRSALLSITLSRVHSDEPPKTGLDQSVIDSLPMFKFSENDTQEEGGTTDCAVCLSVLEEGEIARLLPNCKHTFHAECIDKWLGTHSTCPICRTEAEPRLQPEPREAMVMIRTVPPAPAPPSDGTNSSSLACSEGTSEGAAQCSAKSGASTSRLSSFRRMLSRGSSRTTQSCGAPEDGIEDVERR